MKIFCYKWVINCLFYSCFTSLYIILMNEKKIKFMIVPLHVIQQEGEDQMHLLAIIFKLTWGKHFVCTVKKQGIFLMIALHTYHQTQEMPDVMVMIRAVVLVSIIQSWQSQFPNIIILGVLWVSFFLSFLFFLFCVVTGICIGGMLLFGGADLYNFQRFSCHFESSCWFSQDFEGLRGYVMDYWEFLNPIYLSLEAEVGLIYLGLCSLKLERLQIFQFRVSRL